MQFANKILVIFFVTILLGCSKDDGTQSKDNSSSSSIFSKLTKPAIEMDAPLENFIPVKTFSDIIIGNLDQRGVSEWALVYYALCNCDTDYSAIANNLSEEYVATDNAFTKKKLLDKLTPEIDAKIKAIRANRLVHFASRFDSNGYDFKGKSFKIGCGVDLRDFYNSKFESLPRLEVECINQNDIAIPVADQSLAENLETHREKGDFTSHFYAYVDSAILDKSTIGPVRMIKLKVLKVGISDERYLNNSYQGAQQPSVKGVHYLIEPFALK